MSGLDVYEAEEVRHKRSRVGREEMKGGRGGEERFTVTFESLY